MENISRVKLKMRYEDELYMRLYNHKKIGNDLDLDDLDIDLLTPSPSYDTSTQEPEKKGVDDFYTELGKEMLLGTLAYAKGMGQGTVGLPGDIGEIVTLLTDLASQIKDELVENISDEDYKFFFFFSLDATKLTELEAIGQLMSMFPTTNDVKKFADDFVESTFKGTPIASLKDFSTAEGIGEIVAFGGLFPVGKMVKKVTEKVTDTAKETTDVLKDISSKIRKPKKKGKR